MPLFTDKVTPLDIEQCMLIFRPVVVFSHQYLRLWQNAKNEIKAADRQGIIVKWEKTSWKRTVEKRE
jgi:hypothetical protein